MVAELLAPMFSGPMEAVPLAVSVAVPEEGETVISPELGVAVQLMLSANVVEVSVTPTAVELPGVNVTEEEAGVMV